jgi:anti-anti-sigma regulatory factor
MGRARRPLSARAIALCGTDAHAVLIDLNQISHVTSAGLRAFIAINQYTK